MHLGALMTMLAPGLDAACESNSPAIDSGSPRKLVLTDSEWRRRLTPDQFRVLRGRHTEPEFQGKHHARTEAGSYCCVGCGSALFSSAAKIDASNGRPSFSGPLQDGAVTESLDSRSGLLRVALSCACCDSHLGHVELDRSTPTCKRLELCSIALAFHAAF